MSDKSPTNSMDESSYLFIDGGNGREIYRYYDDAGRPVTELVKD